MSHRTGIFKAQSFVDMMERLWTAMHELLLRMSNLFKERRTGIIFLIVQYNHMHVALRAAASGGRGGDGSGGGAGAGGGSGGAGGASTAGAATAAAGIGRTGLTNLKECEVGGLGGRAAGMGGAFSVQEMAEGRVAS
jgi:hypothetical protein